MRKQFSNEFKLNLSLIMKINEPLTHSFNINNLITTQIWKYLENYYCSSFNNSIIKNNNLTKTYTSIKVNSFCFFFRFKL